MDSVALALGLLAYWPRPRWISEINCLIYWQSVHIIKSQSVFSGSHVDLLVETSLVYEQCEMLCRKEFSSKQVSRPINNDSLSKWVADIPADLRLEARSLAPMLDMLGYDPDAYPPDYVTMVYKAEQLLRQSSVTMATDT